MNCQFNLLWIVFETYFYEAFLTLLEITIQTLTQTSFVFGLRLYKMLYRQIFSSVVFIWFLDLEVKFVVIVGVAKSFLLTWLPLSELRKYCCLNGAS